MGKSTVFVNVRTEERINQFGRDMKKKDVEKSPIKHKKKHIHWASLCHLGALASMIFLSFLEQQFPGKVIAPSPAKSSL